MHSITVIGAGTMGNGIAHVFAQNNYKVTLCDISEASLQKAMTTIASNLDRMVKRGIRRFCKKATLIISKSLPPSLMPVIRQIW